MADDVSAIQTALLALPNSVITSVTCEASSALSTLDGLATYAGTATDYLVANYDIRACKFISNPDTGIGQCVKGYSGKDCDNQNTMSF